MRDFTLIIPTYNRPRELRALLYYLRSTTPGLKFMVLDSSEDKAPVQEIVSENYLVGYPPDTHPFDKFLDGAKRVTTKYCQICADDDLIFIDGAQKCLEALEARPEAPCAKGGAFSYSWSADDPETLRLADGYQPFQQIDQATALERVAALMGRYVAMIYAVWRTDMLVRCLKVATHMGSILGKELLVSNMAAVAGPILSVDVLEHGRSMGKPVLAYRQWHPLEFWVSDLPELGPEYMEYRNRLGFAMVGDGQASRAPDAIMRALDVIHLRYLAQYCPRDVMDYVVDRKARGVQPEGYLTPEIQKSLLNAALGPNTVGLEADFMKGIFDRLGSYMWGLNPTSDSRQAAREARGLVSEAWASLDSPPP